MSVEGLRCDACGARLRDDERSGAHSNCTLSGRGSYDSAIGFCSKDLCGRCFVFLIANLDQIGAKRRSVPTRELDALLGRNVPGDAGELANIRRIKGG